jgi:PIN domain nuclease of toxin-antitoxin system
MNTFYIMDACALIAFLRDELGAEVVTSILKGASEDKAEIRMHSP